jgi:hypothetical protein
LNEEIKIIGTPKLLPQFKIIFNRILTKKSFSASLGKVHLAHNLGFLASLDLVWTKDKLIPLFDWSNEVQALQMWQGYLAGAPHIRVLKYLIPLYEQTFDKIKLLGNQAATQFVDHIAVICVYSRINPLKDGWLTHFIRACDQDSRVLWANKILLELTRLDKNKKLRVWNKWIKQFLLLRLDGIPKIDTDKELALYYQWAVVLGSAFPHIVDILTKFPPTKFENSMVFNYILENKLHKIFPDSTINFLTHILNYFTYPIYSSDLLTIYSELKEQNISADKLRKLLNSLIQFGLLEIMDN